MLWIWTTGGLLLAAYIITQLVRYRGSGNWPVAVATVETIAVHRVETNGHYYTPLVSFSFEVSGEYYSGQWWAGPAFSTEDETRQFMEQNFPLRAQINVRYNPRNPSLNLLVVDPELWDKGKPITLHI